MESIISVDQKCSAFEASLDAKPNLQQLKLVFSLDDIEDFDRAEQFFHARRAVLDRLEQRRIAVEWENLEE